MTSMGRPRVLLVYPRFGNNHFLNFEYMAPFYPGRRAVMPSLGLLTFAAALPRDWEVRLVDENVRPLRDDDLAWADAVAVSGMHPQRSRIGRILDDANRLGKLTVLGGPSASICPEFYPQADVVHVGELGDATARVIDLLALAPAKPAGQVLLRTERKTPLDEVPLPALHLAELSAYIVVPIQFSVGCPYTCEFCDIPAIYGHTPRVKSPARVVRELEAIYARGFVGTILFVDDNLIAHRKALLAMLPAVIDWQRERGYPYPLTGEASVNIARDVGLLRALREARLTHLFLGVESPDPVTLAAISKTQNTLDPLTESIRAIQAAGIEVIMGMIFGFDTDTEATGNATTAFVQASNAPIVYFNLLAALPKTALHVRLEAEGRLVEGAGDAEALLNCLDTNVRFRLPNAVVERMLRQTIAAVYAPGEVLRRFARNAEHVYGVQRTGVPPVRTWAERRAVIALTAGTLARVVWRIGVRGRYRSEFWRFVALLLALRWRGRLPSFLEVLLRVAPTAHHLIEWGRNLAATPPRSVPAPERHPAAPAVTSSP